MGYTIQCLILTSIVFIIIPSLVESQFTSNGMINDDDEGDTGQRHSSMTISSSDWIHVVWCDDRSSQGTQLYYSRSPNGTSFDEDSRISTNIEAYNGDIASFSNNIYVVWQDYSINGESDIYFSRSLNNGESFSIPLKINDETGADQITPSIFVGPNGTINVVYLHDGESDDIRYIQSNDQGQSFSSSIVVNDDINTNRSRPEIFQDDFMCCHIVWRDQRSGQWDIYYSYLIDNGSEYSNDIRVNKNNSVNQYYPPRVVANSGFIYICWDGTENNNIYYSYANHSTRQFIDEIEIVDAIGDQNNVDVCLSQGLIHLVWSDDSEHIYYTNFTPSSKNVRSTTQIEDTISNGRNYPSIVKDSEDNIHVSWTDERYDLGDIFYSRLDYHDISIIWSISDIDENGYNETYLFRVINENNAGIMGAELWLNDEYVGLTGTNGLFPLYNLSKGQHILNASSSYLSNSSIIISEGNGPFILRADLKALDLDEDGLYDDLLIDVNSTYNRPVEGAEIHIDSEYFGVSNESGQFLVEDLEEGEWSVHIRKGRYTNESNFYSEGALDPNLQLLVSMVDSNSSGRDNDCRITVLNEYGIHLEGVEVHLDGKYKGSTDSNGKFQIDDLNKGEYNIDVEYGDLENSTRIYSQGFRPSAHLRSPVDGHVCSSDKITLRWQGTDPDEDSLTYDIYFGQSATPSPYKQDVTVSQLTIKDLEDNNEYFWKVVPSDMNGSGYTSEVRSFTVDINDLPCTTLTLPSNQSILIGSTVTLTWTSQDEENDDLTYTIYIVSDTGSEFEYLDVLEESFVFTPSEETIYHWYVVPTDTELGDCRSGTWWFEFAFPNQVPIALLKAPDYEFKVGEQILLDATGSYDEEDDDELEYFFTFGDGEDSGWTDDPRVYHTYSSSGSYSITLIVRDTDLTESEVVTESITILERSDDDNGDNSDNSIPGMEIIIIVCGMILVIYVKRWRI